MKAIVRTLKVLGIVFAILLMAVVVPVIPVDSAVMGDPVSHTDLRIKADLSDEDVRQIVQLVRRGKFNSLFEITLYDTRSPVLSIRNDDVTWLQRPGTTQLERLPPRGKIVVNVGVVCGRLCGSGVTYYLDKVDARWKIVQYAWWVS